MILSLSENEFFEGLFYQILVDDPSRVDIVIKIFANMYENFH